MGTDTKREIPKDHILLVSKHLQFIQSHCYLEMYLKRFLFFTWQKYFKSSSQFVYLEKVILS